jgi:CheY-like chemotaxis protein
VTTVIERTGVPVPRPGRFAALVVVATPALREAVAYTLRALGARHVLEVSTVAEARIRAAAGVADLCIAEAGLPDGSGIALIRELRAQGWVRGMVLSTSDDPYSVRAAISAGVRSYLVSTATAGSVPVRPGDARGEGVDSLSAREIQVLQLVAGTARRWSSRRCGPARSPDPPAARQRWYADPVVLRHEASASLWPCVSWPTVSSCPRTRSSRLPRPRLASCARSTPRGTACPRSS